MKKVLKAWPVLMAMVVIGLMFGCEDDSDEPTGSAVIQGNIESFAVAGLYYVPEGEQSLWVKVASGISEAFVPSAQAGLGGVIVYLEGPVSRVGSTDDDGTFLFTDLPPGNYTLRLLGG